LSLSAAGIICAMPCSIRGMWTRGVRRIGSRGYDPRVAKILKPI